MSNRKGLGVKTEDVYTLGSDIKAIGWSDKIPDPCCIAKKPDDMSQVEFNLALVENSGGALPALDPIKLEYFALSCNHTLWFLKCVSACMRSADEKLTIHGRLSVDLIEVSDPLFAERIRKGMTWRVLNWRVREYYPELIKLIIDAKNLPGEINRRKSVFETLHEISQLAQTCLATSGETDWAGVRRQIERTKPECADVLPELVELVLACSGGSDGIFLKELTGLWTQCNLGRMSRKVPAKVWKHVASCLNTVDPMPVSYTHLTLPTICSV